MSITHSILIRFTRFFSLLLCIDLIYVSMGFSQEISPWNSGKKAPKSTDCFCFHEIPVISYQT
ncbi:hypothetical protein HanPSC8_Chr02g0070581 [Helianthus annuus]|nr:hypothetical protein HanPSC8_Chr02g0070581 [Helianthus annuus]